MLNESICPSDNPSKPEPFKSLSCQVNHGQDMPAPALHNSIFQYKYPGCRSRIFFALLYILKLIFTKERSIRTPETGTDCLKFPGIIIYDPDASFPSQLISFPPGTDLTEARTDSLTERTISVSDESKLFLSWCTSSIKNIPHIGTIHLDRCVIHQDALNRHTVFGPVTWDWSLRLPAAIVFFCTITCQAIISSIPIIEKIPLKSFLSIFI